MAEKDLEAFKWATLDAVLKISAMIVTKSVRVYVTKVMQVTWRRNLTSALHRLYFTGIRYYQLNVLGR